MRVGFIGTGTMGQPMLTNIIKTGHTVLAWDVVPQALEAARRLGAAPAGSAAEVARGAEITITMLPSSSHVEAAYTGPAGVLEAAPAEAVEAEGGTEPEIIGRKAAEGEEGAEGAAAAPAAGGEKKAPAEKK